MRIGRNQLNELALNEPFVSQWHAVVRFDEHKVRYVDLGSTNGTMMNGRRLARHIQVEVDPQTDLRIGPIQLAFARAQVTPDMYAAPKTTIFQLDQLERQTDGGFSNATIAFNINDPATLQNNTMFLGSPRAAHTAPGVGPAPAPAPPQLNMQQLLGIAEQTKPFYQQYRQAFTQVIAQLRGQLERFPAPGREALILALCQQFPQLPREPEFRQLVESLGVGPAALGEVDATAWIERIAGGNLPPHTHVNTAVAMERVGAVLESYSQAFVELRKGYEQFGEEMALQLVTERNPLHDAESGQDVLRYLLDWTADGNSRVRELNRAFADLAMHQIALLSGVVEGVRAMLHGISPVTLSGQRNHALARTAGGGFLESLLNLNKARLWRTFVDAHQRLIEEDRFSREVFGRAFARAYYMVTGGHVGAEETTGVGIDPATGQPMHPPPGPYQPH
ncbi:MAG: type VI secretion system-associated FHA domain protein [Sandaracinaceae bacterium]